MNSFVTANSNVLVNLVDSVDQIIDQIQVVLCSFSNGQNTKELIANPGITMGTVKYNLGGGFRISQFESIDEAIDFYNELSF